MHNYKQAMFRFGSGAAILGLLYTVGRFFQPRVSGQKTGLFEEFGVSPGKGCDLDVVSGNNGRSYITYAFRDARGEVVYVGRAAGPGTPRQVHQLGLGLTAEVIDGQANKVASQGAEEFFIQAFRELGALLDNKDNALSFGDKARIKASVDKIDKFCDGLFDREG